MLGGWISLSRIGPKRSQCPNLLPLTATTESLAYSGQSQCHKCLPTSQPICIAYSEHLQGNAWFASPRLPELDFRPSISDLVTGTEYCVKAIPKRATSWHYSPRGRDCDISSLVVANRGAHEVHPCDTRKLTAMLRLGIKPVSIPGSRSQARCPSARPHLTEKGLNPMYTQ